MTVIGPITQMLPMSGLPKAGPIPDERLSVVSDHGILIEGGTIAAIAPFEQLAKEASEVVSIDHPAVALPGFIDCHTHICFAGSRGGDYAKRLSGATYQEIAAAGGGILDTVRHTRACPGHVLEELLNQRIKQQIKQGITTCEVKSGYGLTLGDELKMLEAIADCNKEQRIDLIATCLAAHKRPTEFDDNTSYLNFIIEKILPQVQRKGLSKRIDIFVEENAFTVEEARSYLKQAQAKGFSLTLHADQFSRGGALLAAELNASSADHLEQSTVEDARALAATGVVATVLPGATLGLGMPFPPARMLLDAGAAVAIASDWNPGSAPMGLLLVQAALLGAAEKLTTAETFAAITTRAAQALQLHDRAQLTPGRRADIILFPTDDYRDILYRQGSLLPSRVFAQGKCVYDNAS